MSQQTAIDAIIEKLHEQIKASAHGELGTTRTGDYRIGLTKAITICEEFKEMQKQQIIAAAHTGFECGNDIANKVSPEYLSATDYYNKTYEQH
jgi:hypothetical protein